MATQVGIFMSEVSKFVSKYGPSSMFSCKLFTEPNSMDLTIINTCISMYLRTHEVVNFGETPSVLCILEEIDEEMAAIIQDYRGFILNIVLPIVDQDLAERFMNEISYSLNFLKLKHEVLGFKEVQNNV